MKFHTRVFIMLMLLTLAGINTKAHDKNKLLPVSTCSNNAVKTDLQETWWGYFDGDYNNISVMGLGSSVTPPVDYSCAIRIKAGNPELLGKRIKALKFAFERLDYIDNVSIWISENLPVTPEMADVCYMPVEKSSLKSFEKDDDVNIMQFPEPYQVRNKDLYVGYSFTMTSNDGDLCVYPIVVSYANTKENAFLMNWGDGWIDNAGRNYGDLALMLLLDDGGTFTLGDVNYDMKINVVDVSSAIDYILNGEGHIFNIKGADIDANGEINVVDVESIIDMILERNSTPSEENKGMKDELYAESHKGSIDLKLRTENQYRGFQMDIVLPENASLMNIAAGTGVSLTHNIKYARVADNRYRVVVTSSNGDVISSEDILNISTSSDEVKIENIVFATSDLKMKKFANIYESGVASIDNVNVDDNTDIVYDIYGMKANPEKLQKGVYIVNGKKKIIK